MYQKELYLLQIHNNIQVSVTEARISVIPRSDLGKHKEDYDMHFYQNIKSESQGVAQFGDINRHGKLLCRRLQEYRSFECFSFPFFHKIVDPLTSQLLS